MTFTITHQDWDRLQKAASKLLAAAEQPVAHLQLKPEGVSIFDSSHKEVGHSDLNGSGWRQNKRGGSQAI